MKKLYNYLKTKLVNFLQAKMFTQKVKKFLLYLASPQKNNNLLSVNTPQKNIIIPKQILTLLNISDKNSFVLGIEKGFNMPTIPPRIEAFYYHPFMRIFRVIGGICLILVLTKKYIIFYANLHFFILIIAAIHITLIVIILNIRVIFGIYTLIYKKKDFEVRN